jgi:metal-dependent amidase/aminoacylase/carboxypeptidase family protein
MAEMAHEAQTILANLQALIPDLESVYKDIHSHPELSMQENRTAMIASPRSDSNRQVTR